MRDYVGIEAAMRLFDRRAYNNADLRFIVQYLKAAQRNGLEVNFHPVFGDEDREAKQEMLDKGIAPFRMPEIDFDVLVLKIADGRSWLGGDKIRYQVFAGSIDADELLMGDRFRLLAQCLTGMNNIYRGRGILRGAAL